MRDKQVAGWALVTEQKPSQDTVFYYNRIDASLALLDILTTYPHDKRSIKPVIRTGYAYQNKLTVCRTRSEINHWGHVARDTPTQSTQSTPLSTLEN